MSTHRTLVLTTWFCHQFVKIKMREKKRNIKLSFQRIYTCGSTRLFFIRSTRCIALEQISLLLCLQLVWSRLVVWLLFLSNVPPFELRLQFERRKTSSFEYIQGTSTLLQIIEKKRHYKCGALVTSDWLDIFHISLPRKPRKSSQEISDFNYIQSYSAWHLWAIFMNFTSIWEIKSIIVLYSAIVIKNPAKRSFYCRFFPRWLS